MNPAFIVSMIIMDRPDQLQRGPAIEARHCFRKRFALGIVAGLALLSMPQDAGAYVLEATSWPSNSTMLLQLGLGTPGHALQDGSPTWDAAVSPALTMWNQQMQRVQFTGVVNPSAPVSSGDGVNSIVFSSTIFGQSFGSGTLAITYYRSQGANLIEADVLFNSAQTFDSYRGPLQFGSNYFAIGDIRRILLHELGHALGLNHPDSAGQQVEAVMNSTVGDRETLAADDISGIQSLYGAPVAQSSSTSLLWQNNQTGERQIWSMNGTVHTGTSSLGVVSTQWNIATSADFNGDGKVDIVWQNSVTGQRAIWLMNGTTYVSSVNLPASFAGLGNCFGFRFQRRWQSRPRLAEQLHRPTRSLADESHHLQQQREPGPRRDELEDQRRGGLQRRRQGGYSFGRTIPMGSARSGS